MRARLDCLNLNLNVEAQSSSINCSALLSGRRNAMDDIVDLVSRSDEELRALIAQLEADEREISRQRRILQGKLDILRAELVMRLHHKHAVGEAIISADDVAGLSRILAGRGVAPDEPQAEEEPAGGDEPAADSDQDEPGA
jgi:hypothetical protein